MELERNTMGGIIEIVNLQKSFGDHNVLNGVSLSVQPGEVAVIIGSSGSGKSTLLRCINLLEEPTGGDILFEGKSILSKETKKERVRTEIGMVFQSFNLFENMSVLKNCMIGQLTVLKKCKEEAAQSAMRFLRLVGMDRFINAMPRQLSGGQKQRVAIARALAMEPKCLLFDEPTSALDPEMVNEVLDVMRDLAKTGLTMLIVTHEMQFARDVANRVIFIDEGIVLEDKEATTFFDNPEKERTKDFLSRFKREYK